MQDASRAPAERPNSSVPVLPDSRRANGPFRAFSSDPGWREAWWWLGAPILFAAIPILTFRLDPDFYYARILPEGYGFLELTQFIIASIACLMGVWLLFDPFVRQRRFLFAMSILAALACLYIAGEEMSWGQHFFHWRTPEYWSEINRQSETNLHNTYDIFEKTPRLILEIGILIGGLIIPIAALSAPAIRRIRWSIFFPAACILPISLGALLFKGASFLADRDLAGVLVGRPSESEELFYYMFLLCYMIVFIRRIRELKREADDPFGRSQNSDS